MLTPQRKFSDIQRYSKSHLSIWVDDLVVDSLNRIFGITLKNLQQHNDASEQYASVKTWYTY